jgi:hypothetical protein
VRSIRQSKVTSGPRGALTVKRLGLSWNFSSPAWMLSPLELRSQTGNSAQQTSEDEPVSFVCRPTRPAGDPTARAVADKLTCFCLVFCVLSKFSPIKAASRALAGASRPAKPRQTGSVLVGLELDQPFPLLLLLIGFSRSPSASHHQHHNLHRCSAATPRALFHGFNFMVSDLFMCRRRTDTAWNPETRAP